MTPVYYAVLTTLPSEAKAREYLAWLTGGHIDAVRAGGADSARVVQLHRTAGDALPAGAVQVLSQYTFPSFEALAIYERDHAPALRSEGRKKFGPEQGVTMLRMLGEVVG